MLQIIVGHRNNSAALALMQSVREKIPKLPPPPKRKRRRRKQVGRRTLKRRQRVLLLATDGYLAYPRAVELAFGSPPPPGLKYAVVPKQRDEHGHVTHVERHPILGTPRAIDKAVNNSPVSSTINTAFIERHNATDRHRNARKARRTYRFSKNWLMHQAVTYFTYYTYNFCCCVQTLRQQRRDGTHQPRTPAMSAHLTNHIWTLTQWLQQITAEPPS